MTIDDVTHDVDQKLCNPLEGKMKVRAYLMTQYNLHWD